jgi:hypothetical protein
MSASVKDLFANSFSIVHFISKDFVDTFSMQLSFRVEPCSIIHSSFSALGNIYKFTNLNDLIGQQGKQNSQQRLFC